MQAVPGCVHPRRTRRTVDQGGDHRSGSPNPTPSICCSAELHDEAEAEALRVEANTLNAELDNLAVERAEGLLTARQVQIATAVIEEKLAAIEARQHDQERLRVFDGIPLGTPEVAEKVARLSPDRLRAVLAVLGTVLWRRSARAGAVCSTRDGCSLIGVTPVRHRLHRMKVNRRVFRSTVVHS